MPMKKVLIIGGGLFGCTTAIELSNHFDVTLIEKDSELMINASKCNHNRIHYGYHYPRSIETAKQSLEGILLFENYYKDSIVSNFKNYYAIGKYNSKVNSQQYKIFCDTVGIPYQSEFPTSNIINPNLIDDCFRVSEPIYDWNILKDIILSRINNVNIKLNESFNESYLNYDYIINCSYSGINKVNKIVDVNPLNFKYQDVIIPIFEYNHEKIGLTIMDGDYCSIMPNGIKENKFLLYHVKHSVIQSSDNEITDKKEDISDNLELIKKDSARYYPFLKDVKYTDYWRTIRVLPINKNDERLTKIITYTDKPNYVTVFSGKISTCVVIAKKIKNKLLYNV